MLTSRKLSLRALVALASFIALVGCARGTTTSQPPPPLDDASTDLETPPDTSTGCATDDDCRASSVGPVCDPASGRCVVCTAGNDTCPAGQFCDDVNHACVMGCRDDRGCAMGSRCDVARHTCVGCTADDHCAPGTLCRGGTCVAGCSETRPCGVGQTCCDGTCADTLTSSAHCGACGMQCPGGAACCMGACVNTQSDARNCGRCGAACMPPHATAACVSGMCGAGTCESPWGDCDNNPTNGCEADLSTDGRNCGMCGRACTSGLNSTARCMQGSCRVECAAGFGDCDNNPTNGCETSLATSVGNCGMCGRQCPSGAGSTASCALGMCSLGCAAGFGDCDMNPTNGCETSLATTAAHCGGCGVVCRPPNATGACTGGTCRVGTCNAGFADCDMNPANGCETVVTNDSANCGRCGMRCATGTACSNGACSSVCGGGTTFCTDRCALTTSDPVNCGMCGRVCPAVANGQRLCQSSACTLVCDPDYGDCNSTLADGCEVDLRTTLANCGACGVRCARANATPACMQGTCRIGTCNTGFANCNGSDTDGCETATANDTTNCGMCGRTCALPNAVPACVSGACRINTCSPGFANCNANDADGCEVNTSTSNTNCGMCGRTCPAGTACSLGACASVCTGGTTACSGVCVNLQTDARNCGACGTVCPTGQTCTAGTCRAAAPANDLCANAQVISLATTATTITTTTAGANHEQTAPCTTSAGADVFFRFTLAQPELVYADTIGTGYDTVLYFETACGAPRTGTTTTGDTLCNDDMSGAGCTTGGLQSLVVALLPAGTHYLALAGYGSNTGPATIHFQHLPVGNGALALLNAGASNPTGSTSGTGRVTSSTCGSAGPENTWWWKTCPEFTGGTLTASTCTRATWDTVLYLSNGSGTGGGCADDDCGTQSNLSSMVTAGAGVHTLTVDGYFATSLGSYTVQVSRP